ncbi:MAG: DMT family transporter [Alphaproteobacteria bacterium]|nr:DMT family transporter [Alphaproteobacteria bacterium]
MQGPSRENRPILGVIWMLGAIASFASMQISGRELSSDHDALDIMLYRTIVGVVLMLPIALAFGGVANITTKRPLGHLIRNAVHFVGQYGWFFGVAHLTMADVTALNSVMPIFGVVLAVMFFGERPTPARLTVILCGFVGVLIVVRPGMVPIELATGITILGALCYAVSVVMVKALTSTEPALRIVFYMMAMQFVFALVLVGGDATMPDPSEFLWIIVVGISGLTAHYCMARSVAIADASVVMPISFLSLPFMAVVGLIFYDEGLDPFTLGGGGLILAATYLNIIWSRRRGA